MDGREEQNEEVITSFQEAQTFFKELFRELNQQPVSFTLKRVTTPGKENENQRRHQQPRYYWSKETAHYLIELGAVDEDDYIDLWIISNLFFHGWDEFTFLRSAFMSLKSAWKVELKNAGSEVIPITFEEWDTTCDYSADWHLKEGEYTLTFCFDEHVLNNPVSVSE